MASPDLSVRSTSVEIMDDLQSSGPDLHQALRELDAINYLLGGNYVTLSGLSLLLERRPFSRPLHLADLGCGSGDMLRRIRRFLERRGMPAMLYGIDANPSVVKYAMDHTAPACRIVYQAIDIFSDEFRRLRFDVVTASLFFHHFTRAELVKLFKELKEQVSTGIVINDIHRHLFAYQSIRFLTRFFSRSAMVRHDAPLSVARAFRRGELKAILAEAGLRNYKIRWCWAFRWRVVIWF